MECTDFSLERTESRKRTNPKAEPKKERSNKNNNANDDGRFSPNGALSACQTTNNKQQQQDGQKPIQYRIL